MTIDYSSAQAVYDHVCRHLAAQGFQAKGFTLSRGFREFVCLYRDGRGGKCAGGCLIADEWYKPHMENVPFITLCTEDQVPAALGVHAKLVQNLQEVHDDTEAWTMPGLMEHFLKGIADFFELDASILDRLDFGILVSQRLD